MHDKTFQLEIVSAEQEIFSGEAKKLFVTGTQGELEILVNHAPMLTSLAPGPVWVLSGNNKEEAFVILGGMLEVQPKVTIILADAAMRASDIDEAAAINAKKNAEDLFSKHKGGKIDYARAHSDLALALAQLRILRKLRNSR
jgi:F-type H+-transporting ATPase subunit epsilon